MPCSNTKNTNYSKYYTFDIQTKVETRVRPGRIADMGICVIDCIRRKQYIKDKKQSEPGYDVTIGQKAQEFTFSNLL